MARHPTWKKLAAACLAGGALVAARPFGASGAVTTTGVGASAVTLSLPRVSVTDPTGAVRSATLGSLSAGAQSSPGLLSALALKGADVLGTAAPDHSVTSSQGQQSGSLSIPLSSGPVTSSIGLANYLVDASNGTATAQLAALTGSVGVAPLNLSTTLARTGLLSQVTPTGGTGSIGVSLPSLGLKLSDLVPANVLSNLPLGTLLNLVQGLKLTPDQALGAALGQLQGAASTLQALSSNLTSLTQARATLAGLVAANPQLAAAQQAVTNDQSAVNADQAAVNTACTLPLSAACTAAQATLGSDQQKLAGDQQTLSNLESQSGGAASVAQSTVNGLTSTVNGELSQLAGQLASLPNLPSLVSQLLGALAGAPLVDLGGPVVSMGTSADPTRGAASLVCTPGTLTVLGTAVGSATSCQAVAGALSGVAAQLTSALAVLPSAARPAVALDGLIFQSQATPKPDAKGVTAATASLTGLHLGIGAIKLSAVTDALTSQLLSQLGQVGSAVSGAGGLTVPANLPGLLSNVTTQVQSLPTGQLLGGLSTVGVDATTGAVTSQSSFQATPAATTGTSAAPAGTSTATGGLAFTGDNTLADIAAALLIMVVGGQVLVAARRRRG